MANNFYLNSINKFLLVCVIAWVSSSAALNAQLSGSLNVMDQNVVSKRYIKMNQKSCYKIATITNEKAEHLCVLVQSTFNAYKKRQSVRKD